MIRKRGNFEQGFCCRANLEFRNGGQQPKSPDTPAKLHQPSRSERAMDDQAPGGGAEERESESGRTTDLNWIFYRDS